MTTPSRERRTTPQRGIALVTTLLMIAVMLILIGALMENLAKEIKITGMHGRSNSALRAAYEGVEAMQYQFELNDAGAAPGVVPGTVTPPLGLPFTDADGTQVNYSVTVDAARWTSVLPYYVIHSVGTSGTSTRKVDALLQKQPFSAFNLFTISEQNNLGGAVVYTNGEQFNGPVYSGGPMLIFYQDSQPTIFLNTVTTANAPRWIPRAPVTCCGAGTDWTSVITNQSDFQQVSQALTLPTVNDNTAVQWAALAGNPAPAVPPSLPATVGLYINGANVTGRIGGTLSTGLYIKGWPQITSVGDKVGNTNTFTFVIWGAGPAITYHVKVDYGANTTSVTDVSNNPVVSYTGVPTGEQAPGVTGQNGAIWASQGMEFMPDNTFHGKFTFAVPDSPVNHPSMFYLGSQTYADATKDELAFWANDIVLIDQLPTSPNGNIEVDGLLLTGYYGECSAVCNDGTFYNALCGASVCGGNSGTLTLLGSLIENVRGKRGTLGSTISGYATDGVFDPRLARNPPPFTPTTTAYSVIALCTADQGTTCGQQ